MALATLVGLVTTTGSVLSRPGVLLQLVSWLLFFGGLTPILVALALAMRGITDDDSDTTLRHRLTWIALGALASAVLIVASVAVSRRLVG